MSKNQIAIGAVALVLILIGVYLGRAKDTVAPTESTVATTPPPVMEPSPAPSGCVRNVDQTLLSKTVSDIQNQFVTLTVSGFGDIKIQLNDKAAPKTVENFLRLSGSGYYNCLTFHRITDLTGDPVRPGRIVQGGDPNGTGMGGPGYTIPAEIKLPHIKGAIAMARTGDDVNPKRESSGSQFYIAVDAVPFLDNQYTVFGQVVEGMDVVEKMSAVKTNFSGMPASPVVIEKVIISNQ